MRRLRLTGTVRITGPDFWGRQSTLVIEPIVDQTDYRWLWRWKYGHDISVTPKLFRVGGIGGRCVLLAHEGKVVYEIEHFIGWLHALGLRGVRFWLEGSDRPPYMRQLQLWWQIRPLLIQQAPLKLYQPAGNFLQAKSGIVRTISYHADRTQDLVLKAHVNYGEGREASHEFCFSGDVNEQRLQEVLSARTLGKPSVLKPIAWAASHLQWWEEQSEKIVWAPWLRSPTPDICKELAQHKAGVDGALLSLAAPLNSFLGGTINLFRTDHGLDVEEAQELYPHDNVMELFKIA